MRKPQPAAGLGRHQKLLESAQFKAIFKEKLTVHRKFFGVYISGNDLIHSRLGLTVSKRVSKKAVQRNRIKRLIRTSFRLNQTVLVSMDVVVIAKVGSAEQENTVLRAELDRLWSEATNKLMASKDWLETNL